MITYLLYGMAVAALVQPNAPRLFAALVFSSLILTHDGFLSDLDGLAYYGSAALFDLLAIILMSGIHPVPRLVVRLQLICLLSVCLNAIGWALWVTYLPPLIYDWAFLALYTWAVITLIQRDGAHDVGGYTMDRWRSCIRFDRAAWVVRLLKDGNKV